MTVQRIIGGALAVALLAVAPASGSVRKHVVTVPYTGAGTQDTCPLTLDDNGQPDCVLVPTRPGDRWISIEMHDVTGLKVAGFLSQDANGDLAEFGDFCGATDHPYKLPMPDVPYVQVWFWDGACSDGSPSVPTTGKIVATLQTSR